MGALGAPDDPRLASELVTVNIDGGEKQYPLLNITHIMASKLGAQFARGTKNYMDDILFLIQKFPEEVFAIRTQLNPEHRQAFIDALVRVATSPGIIKKAKLSLGIA
jgi:hypothetical protein